MLKIYEMRLLFANGLL